MGDHVGIPSVVLFSSFFSRILILLILLILASSTVSTSTSVVLVVDKIFLFRVCIGGYFRVPLSRSSPVLVLRTSSSVRVRVVVYDSSSTVL